MTVRSNPCIACPYRKDVPSGVWSEHEYEKLRDYDKPTGEQPLGAFACHATPELECNGWAVVHSNRGSAFHLVALRLLRIEQPVDPGDVPLFASGNEAADHGERDIENPSQAAIDRVARLTEKYPRLR